ncbi:gliding motility protein GldB [Parabacteroides sp. PF5-9]|uniref:gliding motility lipoprotein GldB n=1 Tax=Parabacteroides sp. PF5-9 TaxID=1742404 RepID=UPI002473FC90|nr:gliding motility protein GldB [Parabacteroides sp. PF5-9]MDH6357855.1 gliding motility-associated lipoprotein GldB [Parabacteroides sp. PF5-9]
MNRSTFFILFLTLFVVSCNGQQVNRYVTAEPVGINRFDIALFRLIDSGDTTRKDQLQAEYPAVLEVLGKGVLNMKTLDTPGFFTKLFNYYSEPTLKALYRDAVAMYADVTEIEQQLGNGFAYLKDHFPAMQIPVVYMHVSGFNQNVLVGEQLLSLSIDKYLGTDYSLYQEFFYDYQLRKMQRSYVVQDYLTGWLMAEFPFLGKENVLIDRMIYEGKIKYILAQVLPELTPAHLMGYTEEEETWCRSNEKNIWKAIIERKHLYTPDYLVTNRYLDDAPSTFLADGAPGNIGPWMGWQIVKAYMAETKVSLSDLMNNQDMQTILTHSKYRP